MSLGQCQAAFYDYATEYSYALIAEGRINQMILATSQMAIAQSMDPSIDHSFCSLDFELNYEGERVRMFPNGDNNFLVFSRSNETMGSESFSLDVTAYGDGVMTSEDRNTVVSDTIFIDEYCGEFSTALMSPEVPQIV